MRSKFEFELSDAILRQSQIVQTRMAGRAVIKVIHRCNDAKSNTTTLDLSECQLRQVPDAVYHLMRETPLTTCNLANNDIRKITPKFVQKFPHIKVLNLAHNKLSNLPDELKDCTELEVLDLSHNSFVTLPPVLYQLPKIKTIILCNNFIMDVDLEKIPSSCQLEELDIQNNPLTNKTHSLLSQVDKVKINLSPMEKEEWDDLDD